MPGATSTCTAKFIAVHARFGDKLSTAGVNPTAVERPLAAPASPPLLVRPVMRPENIAPAGPPLICKFGSMGCRLLTLVSAKTDVMLSTASTAAVNRLVLDNLVLITFSFLLAVTVLTKCG